MKVIYLNSKGVNAAPYFNSLIGLTAEFKISQVVIKITPEQMVNMVEFLSGSPLTMANPHPDDQVETENVGMAITTLVNGGERVMIAFLTEDLEDKEVTTKTISFIYDKNLPNVKG